MSKKKTSEEQADNKLEQGTRELGTGWVLRCGRDRIAAAALACATARTSHCFSLQILADWTRRRGSTPGAAEQSQGGRSIPK
jgi:hypothetical protein